MLVSVLAIQHLRLQYDTDLVEPQPAGQRLTAMRQSRYHGDVPQLTIDLNDGEDMREALEIIEQRLGALSTRGDTEPTSRSSDDVSPETAKKVVDDLWSRIGSDKTFDLLRAFAELDDDVTLSRVAIHLGAESEDIRARKFRFGRTENAINDKHGIRLLPGVWNGTENEYRMPEAIKHEIRSRD